MPHSKLKQFREQKRMNQTEMANSLFMSQSAYCKLENGETSFKLETILLLLNTYGDSISTVFDLSGYKIVAINEDESLHL